MERIKKRKMKFSCLFGGNDESPRCRLVQSCSPANPTTKHNSLKFEVGKGASKQRNGNRMKKLLAKGISNGTSSKKRSPSILSKLMGRGRFSSKKDVRNPNTTNGKTVNHSSRKNAKLYCNGTECVWRGAIETVPEMRSQAKEVFESENVDIYGYDDFGDDNLHMLSSGSDSDSDEITVPFRIVIHQHDRLTHSLCHMSESSLIREATNRMLEKWNTTHVKDDAGTLSKVSTLGEHISFPDKENRPAELNNVTGLVAIRDVFSSPNGLGAILGDSGRDDQGDKRLITTSRSAPLQPSFNDPNNKRDGCHDADADEKVYGEQSNKGRWKVQKDVFNYDENIPLKSVRSNKRIQSSRKSTGTCFKNEDRARYQPSVSDSDDDAQLSGPESEDAAFASDGFESINSRLQELKKNIHLLTAGSKSTSNKLRLIPKVKHLGQLSSVRIPEPVGPESTYMARILQTLENYSTDPSLKTETAHHPIDPRLFNCLEKFYFNGTSLLRNEKRLFYDYIEQMFTRTSKSTITHPWVNPVKRESQLRSPKLSLVDQVRNVIDEIEKDEDEDFCEVYYDKDLEWVQPTNEIDVLGKFVAELVLNDLVLEVIDF